MSNDNLAVSLAKYACPICGKEADSVIIMNNKLTKKAAKEVKELDGQFIGISNNACSECEKYKDKGMFVIEIDADKSEPNNPYRTGKYWCIKEDLAFFVEHPEYIIKTENGVRFCLADKCFCESIGLYNGN